MHVSLIKHVPEGWERLSGLVLDSVSSQHSRRAYDLHLCRQLGMSTPERTNPLSRWDGVDLSRRRYQRGYLRKHGASWLLTWYEDSLAEGNLKRTRRTDNLGPFSRIGAKEARREADEIMAVINRRLRQRK